MIQKKTLYVINERTKSYDYKDLLVHDEYMFYQKSNSVIEEHSFAVIERNKKGAYEKVQYKKIPSRLVFENEDDAIIHVNKLKLKEFKDKNNSNYKHIKQ